MSAQAVARAGPGFGEQQGCASWLRAAPSVGGLARTVGRAARSAHVGGRLHSRSCDRDRSRPVPALSAGSRRFQPARHGAPARLGRRDIAEFERVFDGVSVAEVVGLRHLRRRRIPARGRCFCGSACSSPASAIVLLSRFSGDWDRSGLNELTIGFTRTRSSARAGVDERFRGKGITSAGAGGRSFAVDSDRPDAAAVATGPRDCSKRPSMTFVASRGASSAITSTGRQYLGAGTASPPIS
jgi:hypothetical protein